MAMRCSFVYVVIFSSSSPVPASLWAVGCSNGVVKQPVLHYECLCVRYAVEITLLLLLLFGP